MLTTLGRRAIRICRACVPSPYIVRMCSGSLLMSNASLASICIRYASSKFWTRLFELLGADVSLTSGYHCQTNGQTERLKAAHPAERHISHAFNKGFTQINPSCI